MKNIIFEVFDNGRKAENIDWIHPICDDFEKAAVYAREWLGQWEECCPDESNKVIDYNSCGDTIEIRKIHLI